MSMHKNARLTPLARERPVTMMLSGRTPETAARAAGVCPRTAPKGEAICHKIVPLALDYEADLLADFTREERAALDTLLDKLKTRATN